MAFHPKREGVYWASFDNGDEVVEVALVHVGHHEYSSSFDDGVVATFVQERNRTFEMACPAQEIVQPRKLTGTLLGTSHFVTGDEVRVTWLCEVKPPRKAPKPGDAVTAP